ncbi:MAG: hypothetical protein H6721_19060 [Sandaracinus sp.]|nr:hypothetical protein [Sandaracinus sp.]MCB9624123.1 hypothetical protein [Sandaracinus sp.]MCB9634228.1 hypothetical protein [Sandaracinus sp.]
MRLLAVVLALVALPVAAQRSVDVNRMRPALDRDGFLGVQGTATPGHGAWNLGLWLDYAKQPLRYTTADRGEVDAIRHRFVADFQAQVGLGSRFALALDLPVLLHQSSDASVFQDGLAPPASQAIGDLRVTGRARIYGRPASRLRQRNEGPGVAVVGTLTLPTGDTEAFMGEGAVTSDIQLIGDFHVFGLGAGLMLGWRHRFDDSFLGATLFRDQLLFGLGVRVPVPWVEGMSVLVETRGELDAREPFGGDARTAIEGDLGVAYRVGDLNVVGLVGTGFTDGVGTPSIRATVGLHWSPRARDMDDDGVPDDVDECPHLPEDLDGFQDDDGCLDPDNDEDFIPDADDRCPNEMAEDGRDLDEDGCTDPEPVVGVAVEATVVDAPASAPSNDASSSDAPSNDAPSNDTSNDTPSNDASNDAPTEEVDGRNESGTESDAAADTNVE